jgi:hypothetical protein
MPVGQNIMATDLSRGDDQTTQKSIALRKDNMMGRVEVMKMEKSLESLCDYK